MKHLILLRGVSGSGKSTLAELLASLLNGKAIAADDYFINDEGKYVFDEKLTGKAHAWCKDETIKALIEDNYNVVIVHNTFVTHHEVEIYKEIAETYNASFYSLIVENRHGGKNTHNVSNEKLESQALRLLNNMKVLNGFNYQAVKTKERDYSKLEVIEYLRQYPVLDEGLDQLKKEYNVGTKKLNGKIQLKYGVTADKTPVIVRECRGLILSEKDLSIVSIPFEKFGNYLESYAYNDIDFSTAKIVEKLDGTCLHQNTKIQTEDGIKTIQEICETKYMGKVLSYDLVSQEKVFDEIITHSIKKNINNWFQIELEDNKTIILTENHKVFLPALNCYREVKYIKEGDEFLVDENFDKT